MLQDRPMHSVSRQPNHHVAAHDSCACASVANDNPNNNANLQQAGD
jgi:hypothetical protein